MIIRLAAAAIAAVALAAPGTALAVAFTGTLTNTNPPAAPGGRCSPSLTVSIGPALGIASGTSSLGSFVPTNSHCIVLPLPTNYFDGRFSFDFSSGNLLTGTYTGTLSATATPGTFANVQNFVVTGGSGLFANTSGSFTGVGTVIFAPGAAPAAFETLSGTLQVAAVPEPASWLLLVTGFATVGIAARRRQNGGTYSCT